MQKYIRSTSLVRMSQMYHLKEDDEEGYKKQFSQQRKNSILLDMKEDTCKKANAAMQENLVYEKSLKEKSKR